MDDPRTPPGERFERTRYGEAQHETGRSDDSPHYGAPQHETPRVDLQAAERVGYEDRNRPVPSTPRGRTDPGRGRDEWRRSDDPNERLQIGKR